MPYVEQWSYGTGFKVHTDTAYDIALPSLWPGCLVAKLNRCQTYQRRQRRILCLFRYSIRCLCAVPRRHQRVIQWPPSLYLYAKLCAILLPDACSQKKEVSSFVHITDILRPPYRVPPLLLTECIQPNSAVQDETILLMWSQTAMDPNNSWATAMLPALSFQQTGGQKLSGDWNWFSNYDIIEESERGGWQVLRHQITDHSPQKVLMRIRCSIPSNFSKEKKRGEKIVLRFRPSHVASNFNQKMVQVFMIRTQCKSERVCWNWQRKRLVGIGSTGTPGE